jgi:hypothetical protein
MPKRHRSIEIYAPTMGIKSDAPSDLLDVRAMPTCTNVKLQYGINQKEYGTSVYATNTGAVVNGVPTFIYEANFPNSAILQVHTPTNIYAYTSGSDTYFNDGQTFTGTYNDFWSGVMHNDAYVYCNGQAPLQYKASFSATGTNLPGAVTPTTFSSWSLLSMRDHLLMYHVFENGGEYFKRVRWSKKGALTYVAGTTDFASGVAGGVDIQDCEGEIKGAAPLSGGAAVYAENSIHYQYWVGGDEVWRFQKTVSGIGTIGRRTFVSYAGVNYFLSQENIYKYAGGDTPDPIGNPIKQAFFSELNQSAQKSSFLDFDAQENELLVYIPTGTATQPDICWVYRVKDDAWSRKARQHSSATTFSRRSGLTIGDLVGDIGAQNFTFGDALVRAEAHVKIFGDPSGRVVKHDPTRWSLSSTGTNVAQAYVYETPDITGNKATDPIDGDVQQYTTNYQRWQRLTIDMKGTGEANVSYSTDYGQSFVPFAASPITMIPAGTRHLLDMDVSSPVLRLRISNSGLNEFVAVKYAKLDFIPGPNY